MGSVGDSYGTMRHETGAFYATLECELIDRYRFKTQAEPRMAVFGFIEGWYEPRRRHSSLGYESPDKLRHDGRCKQERYLSDMSSAVNRVVARKTPSVHDSCRILEVRLSRSVRGPDPRGYHLPC